MTAQLRYSIAAPDRARLSSTMHEIVFKYQIRVWGLQTNTARRSFHGYVHVLNAIRILLSSKRARLLPLNAFINVGGHEESKMCHIGLSLSHITGNWSYVVHGQRVFIIWMDNIGLCLFS